MDRHKHEYHEDAKRCPWCEYTTKRDQRLLEHIDDHHRPRKHKRPAEGMYQHSNDINLKSHLMIDSTSYLASQYQSGSPRANDEMLSGTASSPSIQGHTAFGAIAPGLGLLQPQKQTISQHARSENLPTLAPQPSGLQAYTARSQAMLEEGGMISGSGGRSLARRPRMTAGSESMPGGKVVRETARNTLVGFEQSSLDISAPGRNTLSIPTNNMPAVQRNQINQGAQRNHLQAYSMFEPEMQFAATPYSPHAPQTPFYDFSMPFFAPNQPSTAFTVPVPTPLSASPSHSYRPCPPYVQQPTNNSLLYPQAKIQSRSPPSNSAAFGQDQGSALPRGEDA